MPDTFRNSRKIVFFLREKSYIHFYFSFPSFAIRFLILPDREREWKWYREEEEGRLCLQAGAPRFLLEIGFFLHFPIPYCISKDAKEEKECDKATGGP